MSTTMQRSPSKPKITANEADEAKNRLVTRVILKLHEMYPGDRGMNLRVSFLWSSSGVARFRANWWKESDIVVSRFVKVYEEEGQMVLKTV